MAILYLGLNLMFPMLAFVISGMLIQPMETCSIFCEDGKVPCGGYGATCEGFKGCVFPGECSSSSGSNNRPVTVPNNYDVIRPYGPTRPTRRPYRPNRPSYNRPFRSSYRRRYNRYNGK